MRLTTYCIAAALAALVALPAHSQQRRPPNHGHGRGAHKDPSDVRSDLRMLGIYQAEFQGEHGRYSTRLDSLGMKPSRGVTVEVSVNGDAYAAVSSGNGEECAVVRGAIQPPRPYVTRQNTVMCDPQKKPARRS